MGKGWGGGEGTRQGEALQQTQGKAREEPIELVSGLLGYTRLHCCVEAPENLDPCSRVFSLCLVTALVMLTDDISSSVYADTALP